MRKLILILLPLLTFMINSCNKDDEKSEPVNTNTSNSSQQGNVQPEEVRYYVKYEMSSTTLHAAVRRTLTFTTEKGTQTIEIKPSNIEKTVNWEGTYGPFKKEATVTFYCSQNEGGTMHGRIYVSRDKEPFVIKAEQNSTASISLGYTIDF